MRSIVPYPYQALDADTLLGYYKETRHAAAIYCTGAGKSALALIIAAKTMGVAWKNGHPQFSHVVIAAPSKVIRDAFEQLIVEDDGGTYETPVVEDEAMTPKGLSTYLEFDRPDKIVRMTHVKLIGFKKEMMLLPSTFATGKLLVIDEAHRGGERQQLAQIRELWLNAGGSVLDLTATPDRSDRTIAISDDVLSRYSVRRSMTDQMADGLAPERLLSDVLWVDCEARFDGETMFEPIEPTSVAASIVKHLEADGWPKAIGRLKNAGNFAVHNDVICAVARAVAARGKRVFVASEVHLANSEIRRLNQKTLDFVRARSGTRGKGDLSEVLAYESTIGSIGESCVDFIIGMHTVLEGMNWEVCSHIYFVGVPRFLLPFVQGVGRTMRSKKRFPPYGPWRMRSKVVLLAAGEKEQMSEAHRAQMLSLACYLASFRQWSIVGAISDVFENIMYATPLEKERLRRMVKGLVCVSDEKAVLIREAMARMEAVYERVVEEGSLSIRQQARLTKVFIDMHLVNVVREEDRSAYAAITEREIEQVLVLSRHEAQSIFAASVRDRVARGVEVTEAVRQSLDDIMETFAVRVNEPTEASLVVQDVVQAISLDADAMRLVDAEVSGLLGEDGPPVIGTSRRVRGPIGRAIEELRR